MFEADARPQAEKQVEVVKAIGYAQHFESALGNVAGGNRLARDETSDALELLGESCHGGKRGDTTKTATEKANDHCLSVRTCAHVSERSHDVTILGDPVGDDTAVGCAAESVVAQVVGKHVVSGIVEDLVVGHQIDFESVSAWRPGCVVRVELGWNARSTESQGVIGDNHLVGSGGGNEPGVEWNTVSREECDVLVFESVFGR